MKKPRLFQFFSLLIIFVTILAGCGGGGGKGNPQSSTIQFLMPDIYIADGIDYPILQGKRFSSIL